MTLHPYCVLSTYTPITCREVATLETKKVSTSLLIKLFSRPLTEEEDVASLPANSGDHGIATFIITKTVVCLKNQTIPNLDDKYPQLAKIIELAQSLTEHHDRGFSQLEPIYHFIQQVTQGI